MFGPGLPILYPTFLLALIIQWLVERLCMAYYYKQPPMYDEKLSNRSVLVMQFTIILQMFFGYWMFSNRQMFSNKVYDLEAADSMPRSGHSIWNPIEIDQAAPFLLVAGMAIIMVATIIAFIYV